MGLFSGIFGGGGSAKRAADVAARKQSEAGQMIWDQYQDTRKDYQPYTSAGESALSQYQAMLPGLEAPTAEIYDISKTMDPIVQQIREGDFTKSPGYDFRMREGQKALEQAAAAKGQLYSGATGKALTRYGQDYATSEYDNFLNRKRAQLGDIQTQLGGRTTALGAKYDQMGAYTPLIETGYNATGALAGYGANAAAQRAGYKAGEGATYASGIQAKDAQMKAAGDWIINRIDKGGEMLASVLTGGAIKPSGQDSTNFGKMPQQQFGGGVSTQPYGNVQMGQPVLGGGYNLGANTRGASPWVNPNNISYGASDPSLPWLSQGQQEQAALRTQSAFA